MWELNVSQLDDDWLNNLQGENNMILCIHMKKSDVLTTKYRKIYMASSFLHKNWEK